MSTEHKMPSVLASIQPKWCEKIFNQIGTKNGKLIYEKSLEIRKTVPKIGTPFKCYIYQTRESCQRFIDHRYNSFLDGKSFCSDMGKVIGEFVCDNIMKDYAGEYAAEFEKYGCVSLEEQKKYSLTDPLYGWYISELKRYDRPKDLREFGVRRAPQSWMYVYGLEGEQE